MKIERYLMAWTRTGLIAAIALTITACAATPRVNIATDPNAAIGSHATFTFQEPLRMERGSDVKTILGQLLRSLATSELESRGYRYVTEKADLEVNFLIETREKLESVPEPGSGMRYGYSRYPYGPYGVWTGYERERIRQYTVGTLRLGVVDVARKQLVWEAIAVGRVKPDLSYEQDDVRDALTQMFEGFPARHAPSP